MTLLLDREELDARRAVATGGLHTLAQSLAGDLRKVIARPLYIPEGKALLSREGGRCPRDGMMLDFDPFSPHEHRCPKCGEVFRGELHDGFWIYWYQLWLAERAVHAAILGRLGVLPEASAFAAAVLDGYSDRYLEYPNVDNALGPTRPFFSTYLESIWLLQLCVAAGFLDSPAVDRFRDAVCEPSLVLIDSFNEGTSNRQVWNNAALMAGNRLLGREDRAESIVWAKSGVVTHLTSALLPDGTWYEGENYHFFAHRGLWYCMELASQISAEVPEDLVRRYEDGFRAPFLTTLPDLTFPSRRDSQYAVSLRQWRFAEMCELGLAKNDDRILRGMLARLYADDIPRGDSGRWKSTAEAERNLPAARLDRSGLGWKSLLFAKPTLEVGDAHPLPSVLLESQGIGVIRRSAGKVYVALDYGISGGGHGHPDRLNLLISDGDRRILDDVGTGSYVDASLHWYRSTLAHNAPLLDGRSQPRVDGTLDAWEDRGAAGWVSAHIDLIDGHRITRTLVAMPDYLLDEIEWNAADAKTMDLPMHIDAEVVDDHASWTPARLQGSAGDEDGFRFLTDTMRLSGEPSQSPVRLRAKLASGSVDVWIAGHTPFEVWRVKAPGAPGRPAAHFILLRSTGAAGAYRIVWSWAGTVTDATLFPVASVVQADSRHLHSRVQHGWHIDIQAGSAKSSIDLEGLRQSHEGSETEEVHEVTPVMLPDRDRIQFHLSEQSYRRSEQSWREAGRPSAAVVVGRAEGRLTIDVTASDVDRTFAPATATNRLDNEHADINGASIQLYLATGATISGYVIVPEEDSDAVRIRPIDGWGDGIPVAGRWQATPDGYHVHIDVSHVLGEAVFGLNVIVNEKPAGRERRRGQLVMSGGFGETVYLRGDRHDRDRLITFALE